MSYDYIREEFENRRPKSGLSIPEMNQFLRGLLPLMQQARIGEVGDPFFNVPKTIKDYAATHRIPEDKARKLLIEVPQTYVDFHQVQFFHTPKSAPSGP